MKNWYIVQTFSGFEQKVAETLKDLVKKQELGEKIDDPYNMYLNDLYTLPVNISGNPAISMPCGFSNELPIGLQLIAKPFDEKTLLRATYAYQSLTDWHMKKPHD